MTRTEAAKRGLIRYPSNKPCKYGHQSERYTSTGKCVECGNHHRSRHRQLLAGSLAGWPTVTTAVPLHMVSTLRTIVHDMRGHGPQFDRRRAAYVELAHDLHVGLDHEPVADVLSVTPGRPVDPVAMIPPQFRGQQ